MYNNKLPYTFVLSERRNIILFIIDENHEAETESRQDKISLVWNSTALHEASSPLILSELLNLGEFNYLLYP